MDLELRLELADPPPGGCQLGPLRRRQAGDEAPVDLFLMAPEIDGLAADPQVAGQVGRPPTGREQDERATSGIRVDTLLCPWLPPVVDDSMIPVIRLHERQGTPFASKTALEILCQMIGARPSNPSFRQWSAIDECSATTVCRPLFNRRERHTSRPRIPAGHLALVTAGTPPRLCRVRTRRLRSSPCGRAGRRCRCIS